MIVKRITEYERIRRSELSPVMLDRLQRFDEEWSREKGGATVFDWSRIGWIGAGSWVGVVQVPGLTVQILPKIDGGDGKDYALDNLLYMLSYTHEVPMSERDVASLQTQDMDLMDALVSIFAKRLLTEVSRGQCRGYVHKEEILPVLKGKLLVGEHIRRNAVHKERFAVGYDEFTADTTLNRMLKAAVATLLKRVSQSRIQTQLRTVLAHLDPVSDVVPVPSDRDKVFFSRANERYRPLFEFSCMILFGQTPMPKHGQRESFSLLFSMNDVFEEFIGNFILRHADKIGLRRQQVHLQAAHRRRALVKRENGKGKFYMKPDVLIDHPTEKGAVQTILDTKWKRLSKDGADRQSNDLSISDFYQLYAYGTRYDCDRNILLYPEVAGAKPTTFHFDENHNRVIQVATIDVSRQLQNATPYLLKALSKIIHQGQAESDLLGPPNQLEVGNAV